MEKNTKGYTQILITILLLVVVAGGAYYFGTQKSRLKSDLESKISVDDNTSVPESPSKTPDQAYKPNAQWKTFLGTSFVYTNKIYTGYTFLYPESCEKKDLSLICKTTHGTGTIIVNAGGHGGENVETKIIKSNETKVIPVGEGKITLIQNVKENTIFGTFWINKTDKLTQEPIFGFEFVGFPYEDLSELTVLIDELLSSFNFTN